MVRPASQAAALKPTVAVMVSVDLGADASGYQTARLRPHINGQKLQEGTNPLCKMKLGRFGITLDYTNCILECARYVQVISSMVI